MDINKNKALDAFREYTSHYNAEDPKVKLKIDHTYRVADLCRRIASDIGLGREEIDLAWLCGLLHDVGRFEQLKNYGTFNDAESIDHARYGASILFDGGKIRNYIEADEEDELLRDVISCHSAYRIPAEYGERTVLFANILRDADKIDILKVNVEIPLEEIYNVSTEELKNSPVTPEVLASFLEEKTVLRTLKKTPADNLVGHASLVYELVFPVSLRIMAQQGYLDKLLSFTSCNQRTEADFVRMREKMGEYMKNKE